MNVCCCSLEDNTGNNQTGYWEAELSLWGLVDGALLDSRLESLWDRQSSSGVGLLFEIEIQQPFFKVILCHGLNRHTKALEVTRQDWAAKFV